MSNDVVRFVDRGNLLAKSEFEDLRFASYAFLEFIMVSQIELGCFDEKAIESLKWEQSTCDRDLDFSILYRGTKPCAVIGNCLILSLDKPSRDSKDILIHAVVDASEYVQSSELTCETSSFTLSEDLFDYLYIPSDGVETNVFSDFEDALKALQLKRLQLERAKGLRGFFV